MSKLEELESRLKSPAQTTYETRVIFRADTYKQVVGHIPVGRIFEKDGIISTDVFFTYRDGRQIGEYAMIVIDSETGKYADRLILLTGANGTKARKAQVEELNKVDDSKSLILVGMGSLLGEGFDFSRLDTLFMATPISGENVWSSMSDD